MEKSKKEGYMRCTDCAEHSGHSARLHTLEQVVLEFKSYMSGQTARSFAILIMVIASLFTGIVSIYINSQQRPAQSVQLDTPKIIQEISMAVQNSHKEMTDTMLQELRKP